MLSGYRTMLWRTRARATLMHDAQIGVGERLIYLIPAMFARAPLSCSPRSAAAFGIFAIMLKRVGELRDGFGADQASGDAFADQTLAARGLGLDDLQVACTCLMRPIADCFRNTMVAQDFQSPEQHRF